MIPKKAGTDVDLNAQIDKDLQQAQEAQKDKITKNKPTLAQAIGSKYLKLVVAGVIGVGIAYKMFFAPEPENVKGKKKVKKQVETSKSTIDNIAEKKKADAKLGKTTGQITTEKTNPKQVLSLNDQTISNSQSLSNVSVPKLELPKVPEIPIIDKITIKETQTILQEPESVKDDKKETNGNNKLPTLNNKTDVKTKNNDNTRTNTDTSAQNTAPNNKKTTIKKKRKKILGPDGKTRTILVEVEVDETGKEIKELSTTTNPLNNWASFTTDIKTKALSSQLAENLEQKNKLKIAEKKQAQIQKDIASLGQNALDNMFILSGKGASSNRDKSTANESKKDFILFDGASISESTMVENESYSTTSKIQNSDNTIAAGKIMEAVLETAINSETAGTIRAVMSKDVIGETGTKILIPKGSRLYGSYTTTTTTTQSRLLLTWTKVIRPDGIVISMNADTYDQTGKKGIEGDIDTRYGELFKNSLLYSFVTLGTAIAVEKIANIKGTTSLNTTAGTSVTNTSPANAAATSVIDTAKDIADKMTDGLTDDLNPVISIPQGTLLKVMSSTDIVVSPAYKRKRGNINLG